MAKTYGETSLDRFRAAEERRQERRREGSKFFTKLMAGSKRHSAKKKYDSAEGIALARAKKEGLTSSSSESKGKTAPPRKPKKTVAEKRAERFDPTKIKAADKKESLLKKFKSSKTLAEFAKKIKNK
jgi:hypothetical protein